MKLVRAKTARQIIEKKRDLLEFEGEWKRVMGQPERGFFGIVWAKSFSGKTTFMVAFLKYLAEKFGGVVYDSLEEGDVGTFAKTLKEAGLLEMDSFKVVDEPWSNLVARLLKRKSADFAIVDSFQYADIDYVQYKHDKKALEKKGKSVLFISHAEGNNPFGKSAFKVRYDVALKIQIIGYVANIEMRGNGRQRYVIWEEGAKNYWGKKLKSVLSGQYWPGDKK